MGGDPINMADPTGMATVKSDFYREKGSNIMRQASVEVDADVNNDGTDDLTAGQLKKIGKDFTRFIQANNERDISGKGKNVTGNASLSDKAMVSVVSQFVGASGLASGWGKVDSIDASKRNYLKFGPPAYYRPITIKGKDTGRGVIFITGAPMGWLGGYLYGLPSDLARGLFHESGHTPIGIERDHDLVDTNAKQALRKSGLDGGGCSRYGPLGGGFGGCGF